MQLSTNLVAVALCPKGEKDLAWSGCPLIDFARYSPLVSRVTLTLSGPHYHYGSTTVVFVVKGTICINFIAVCCGR